MEQDKIKGVIESILFAAGREVRINELMSALEISSDEVINAVNSLKEDYESEERGLSIINVEDSYQLCTKKENYEYIYPIFDKRSKPNLSNAALETLAIIAYNPCITRAEIETIRGVNSDGTLYRLLDYNLIEESGKLDAPGRPMTYKTSNEFLKMFGISNLKELPSLPRYKLDENRQIVIDEIIDNNEEIKETDIENTIELNKNREEANSETIIKEKFDLENMEAPMPEREKIGENVENVTKEEA